ncbi:TPA: hypothetical protein N0F65_007600 [Lagenidium giganteum]|uniref:Uncharacterized protein n=1 Tax=Lagenidium giganteum TaxID=4803 RepID=A0AAV2ZEY8_9STRA|nr:TPA: hypothetical protein N0F65_007600 [Lagenidium giganteum]
MVLVISQLLSIFWHSLTSHQYMTYGRSPLDGPYFIPGANDEPYTDRMIVCMRQGSNYTPMQLSKALTSIKAKVINANGSAVHGYRVVQRNEIELDPDTEAHYVNTCNVIAETLVGISDSCTTLGYNVANDTLRIVDDIYSNTMKELQGSLPVLMTPYWDNTMPGWDGNACVHRLLGKYESPTISKAILHAASRSVRESKTVEWLKAPGGVWKNGWYEDTTGQRWYSEVQSSDQNTAYGIALRQFDTEENVENDCRHTTDCDGIPAKENWGSMFTITETVEWFNGVAVSNGSRYGLFLYEAYNTRVVKTTYDLATFISNISVVVMLFRWAVCMFALHRSYRIGLSRWYNAGLGSLACARSFNALSLVLMPRLKMTLAAFWTVGGEFEGQQKSLSEAWFVIYPAIGEFLLFYYSLLNIAAKVFRRRMSDVLFGPTLLFFCAWHYYRTALTHLFVDGRFSTMVLSTELENMTLLDLFTTDTALRLCGNVRSMLAVKLAVLGLSSLPLLRSDNMTRRSKLCNKYQPCQVELTLVIRASNVGGLGRSNVYDPVPTTMSVPRLVGMGTVDVNASAGEQQLACTLNSYEINRLGYLVYGRRYLISFNDWYIIVSIAPFAGMTEHWNHRITIIEVIEDDDGFHLHNVIQLCRLDDRRLLDIPFYDVTTCAFH